MRSSLNRVASLGTVLILMSVAIATEAARAETHPITYKLDRPGNVSVNVYDSSGAIVRELQHAAPQLAGEHTLVWDGLDRTGKGVAPGAYGWKLLQTPGGLSSEYLLKVGGNYPIGTDLSSSDGPGTHNAPYTVAIDENGTYISALQTENIESCMIKLSGTGGPDAKREWSQKLPVDDKKQPVAWEGARSIAVDRGEIYLLGHTASQRIFVTNAATGEGAGRTIAVKVGDDDANTIDPSFKTGAADMDVHDGVLVASYIGQQKVRWFDPKTGALLDTADVPNVQGVAVGNDGVVFATSGDAIVRFSREKHELVTVVKGLTQPGRLDVDHSTNELIVSVGGDQQQILRIAIDGGKIAKTYGRAGGRQDGLYVPTDFQGVADVTADGHGGFFAVEPYSAPRRVAHFDGEGKLINEWYGGQRWAPQAAFEPNHPEAMWVCCTASLNGDRWIMRVLVDYEHHSWNVHSCYRFTSALNPLMHDSSNETGLFRIHEHAGVKYLAMESTPSIWRIDDKAGRLTPITAITTDYQWNDVNGDGLIQENEKTKFEGKMPASYYVTHIDDNFDYFFIDVSHGPVQVRRIPVVSWNAAGAPVYGKLPAGDVFGDTPARFAAGGDGRWGAFLFHDTVSGKLYATLNPITQDWCTSVDTFTQQWDASGKLTWAAGERGPAPLSAMQRYMPTEPGQIYWNLRGLAGVAHDCIVTIDVNGGWFEGEAAHSYVWDADGLFVGGIMDHVDLKAAPQFMYRCGGEFCHADVLTLPNGDVLFSGNWENDSHIYKVTGWNDWQRQSGAITVKQKSDDDRGQGLTFETIDANDPAIVRDVSVQTPDGATALKPGASVRWRGTITPAYGPKYTNIWVFTPSGSAYGGGVRTARTDDARCEFTFRGTSIAVVGAKGPNYGYANVYLDGKKEVENLDCYDPAGALNVTYFSKSGLAAGDHTVILEAIRGELYRPRNPKATDAVVSIDKFVVDGVDIDDEGLAYTFSTSATSAATQLWVDKRCITYDGSTAAARAREVRGARRSGFQRRAYPIQLDAMTAPDAKDAHVTLSYTGPWEPKQTVPTAALFPVTITAPIPAMRIACTPLDDDTKTQGNWRGVYGRDGYSLANVPMKVLPYVELGIGGTNYTWWKPDPADVRALQVADGNGESRYAGAWYAIPAAPMMTFDLNFTDGKPHQFAIYLMDVNRANWHAKVDVIDVVGQTLQPPREITMAGDGRYLRWTLAGHVSVRVSNVGETTNPLIPGVFFDPASP